MKFVLALLGAALAADPCDENEDGTAYLDTPADCEAPECTGTDDLEGCTPVDCTTADDVPHEGCNQIDCTDSAILPYDGCKVAACDEDDDDETKYDDESPYKGCAIPECGDDDKHENCVEAETVYCAFEADAAPAYVKDDPAGCVDPCSADREEDDKPDECTSGSSTGLIIVLVLAAVGGLAGAFYCKHQKKACFKEKPEGGKFESLTGAYRI